MELLLVCAMVGLVAVGVTRPLRRPPAARDAAGGAVRALEAARDAKLREIHDAELDLETGKLTVEDHRALDGRLRAEAMELLRELDGASDEAAA